MNGKKIKMIEHVVMEDVADNEITIPGLGAGCGSGCIGISCD